MRLSDERVSDEWLESQIKAYSVANKGSQTLAALTELRDLRDRDVKLRELLYAAVGKPGDFPMHLSMLSAAKFCREFAATQRHTEAVADCCHCTMNYAAHSIEKLLAAINAALQPQEQSDAT